MAYTVDKKKFEKADKMVGFKMTKTERDKLQKVADSNEITVSKLVRDIVVKAIK